MEARDPEVAGVPSTQGDAAFDARLAAELPPLATFLARLTRGTRVPVEVDDLVQEVAARALRYRATFDAQRPLGPWLQKSGLRLFLDRRARALREADEHSRLGLEVGARESQPQSTLEQRERIALCLSRLSPREQEILLRFHHRGQSLREIAQSLGLPEGTVKSHLHRGRSKLLRGEA